MCYWLGIPSTNLQVMLLASQLGLLNQFCSIQLVSIGARDQEHPSDFTGVCLSPSERLGHMVQCSEESTKYQDKREVTGLVSTVRILLWVSAEWIVSLAGRCCGLARTGDGPMGYLTQLMD